MLIFKLILASKANLSSLGKVNELDLKLAVIAHQIVDIVAKVWPVSDFFDACSSSTHQSLLL